jgi:tryptophanyl-tRNA synthetase
MYFQLTDDEKFFSKPNLTLEETGKFAYENALDFIALGFKPEKTKIIINTRNIQTLYPIAAQVAKKINFSNTKATFGFTNDTSIGMIFYTSLQSAPCFLEDKPVLIPLGVDQDPHKRHCSKDWKAKACFDSQHNDSRTRRTWRKNVSFK